MIKKEIADKLFKAELSEQQKVEFATIYDDLNGSIREANMGFVQATDFVSKAQKEVRKSINDNEALLKELNKADKIETIVIILIFNSFKSSKINLPV